METAHSHTDAPRPGRALAVDEASPELVTYLGLRVAIVALTALLAVAVFLEDVHLRAMAWPGKLEGFVALGSISAYWYTSAQSALIAVLVGYGVCLVAIRGETGLEETCLNAAGVCAPVVGFVPTSWPRCAATAPYRTWCPGQNGFEDRVANSIVATLVAGGGVILVVVVLAAVRRRVPALHVVAGFVVTTGFYVAMLVWFVASRDSFVRGAHGVAAIGLFGGVLVVAISTTFRSRTPLAAGASVPTGAGARVRALLAGPGAPRLVDVDPSTPRPRAVASGVAQVLRAATAGGPTARGPVAALYLVSTVALGVSLLAVVVIFVAVPAGAGSPRLFWIEWVLLVFFVVFWVVQTIDVWGRKRPR